MDRVGQDLIVTGDPAGQAAMSATASALMAWASEHQYDPDFLEADPRAVLADLLVEGPYGALLDVAAEKPLIWLLVDRNELLPEQVILSFGKTVAMGVGAVALLGLFIGAEVITAGQATWLLVALAGTVGGLSYAGRRDEVDESGYDVSIPETVAYAAGDVVGVSQLIEGVTGERLGTGAELGSEARSELFGAGAGGVATLLSGSRAFRQGHAIGTGTRAPGPMRVPSGPNANNIESLIPAEVPLPARPMPAAEPTAREAALRATLPDDAKVGLDMWMAEVRAKGADPEVILERTARAAPQIARNYATRYARETAEVMAARRLYERSRDYALKPLLEEHYQVPGEQVWVHFEKTSPTPEEIAHAVRVARRTREPVHIFGDTASNLAYPGVDGTIGYPPRPLQLKTLSANAPVSAGRFKASEALIAGKREGYSHIQVEIELPGRSLVETIAGWNIVGEVAHSQPLAPYYEGDIVAKIVVVCRDGAVWSPPKPGPAIPARPAVPIPVPGLGHETEDEER